MKQAIKVLLIAALMILAISIARAQQPITQTPFYVYLVAPNSDTLARDKLAAKLREMRGVRLTGVCKELPCDEEGKEDVRISLIAYESKFQSGRVTNYWNFSIVFGVRSPKKDAYYIVQHWMRTSVFVEDLDKTCDEIVKLLNDGVFEPIRKVTVHRDKTASK
jgi:hypothetical protein